MVCFFFYSAELFREGTAALTLREYTEVMLVCNVFLSLVNTIDFNKFEFTRIENNGY